MNEKDLSAVNIFAEWPKMYCIHTDKMRLVTQKDVDDMRRIIRVYGTISNAVKQLSSEVQAEQGHK